MWSSSKSNENYKPIDPRKARKPKQDKHKENHTKAHHNQTSETSDKEKTLKAFRENDTLHIEE